MATVRIPPILRPEAGNNRQVELSGATIRDVLENLIAEYPSLRERIFDGDDLPQFLNVFIDGSDVRLLNGLDTEVAGRGDRDPPAGGRRRFRFAPLSEGR